MLRLICTTVLLISFALSFGQTTNIDLSKIQNVSQAETFIQRNPRADGKLFTIESSSDTSELLLPLYNKNAGFTFRIDNNIYKVLRIDSILSFRVNYIYLNGEQHSKNQIDSLRQEIISKYKAGTSFFDLVQQYNMNGNYTGDTGWFTENTMVKAFESAVKSHKINEIFTIDTPEKQWYHVVLKTFDNTFIKKVTLLKLMSSQ